MSRRHGFVGYIDARADRLALERASSARRAADERRADEAAETAAAAAQRAASRPKPAPKASPAPASAPVAQRGARPSAPETRTIAKSEYDLLIRAANAVLKKF